MAPRFTGLRARLFSLVTLAVLPALGLVLYTGLEQRKLAATQAQDEALRLARRAAAEQAQLVQGAHQLLAALAHLPVVRDGDPSGCNALFTTLLKHYPAYANLGASKADGESFCSATPLAQPVNSAAYAWFRRAVHTREFSVGEYQKSLATGNFTLILGYPIRSDADQVQGVVAAALDLGRLNQLAAQAQLPPGATLIAIDRNGTIIARHPDPQHWLGLVVPEAPLVKAMLAHGEGTAEIVGADGVQRLYAFTRVREVGDVGMSVGIGIPAEVAFAGARWRLTRSLIALGLITAVVLAAALVGSELLVLRPVKALVGATEQLRRGDLTARAGLSHGLGELSQLAAAFDGMAAALERREAERQRAEETLQYLSRRLLEAQESERRAIARELHDELGQALQATKINLQTARRFPQEGSERLEESIGIVDRALQQVRNLSLDLRPSVLDDLGLVDAVEWYVERQAQRVGFEGHVAADPVEPRPHPTVETACFRAMQEALTNVARHARARKVWVELQQDEAALRLLIRDDGVGFDVRAAEGRAVQGASFGLLGMRERVELVGGHIEIHSAPGRGTEIRARFPLHPGSLVNDRPSPPHAFTST